MNSTTRFEHGGEMGVRMRETDWSATPVGRVESWPESLKSVIAVLGNAQAYEEERQRAEALAEIDRVPQPTEADTRIHVLLADDNPDLREYVARLLRARWSVEAVADGEAALTAVRQRRPTLILTDVMMPGLDGFGLLRELRGDPATRSIPVMILSARAGEESRVEGLEAGPDDYLIKPFSSRELIARVAARLERRHLGTPLAQERA